jgi:hypothetical protein
VSDDSRTDQGPEFARTRTVVVLFAKSDDLCNCLLSVADGGRHLDRGIAARVDERTGGSRAVALSQSSAGTVDEWLAQVQADPALLVGVDVVVMSVAPELAQTNGTAGVDHYESAMGDLVRAIKDRGARLIVFNGSSFNPDDETTCYAGIADTPSVHVQRLNLSVVRLSVLDGISIVDADRIISELGGEAHVHQLLQYSTRASDRLCDEFLRVVEDYGFFDNRPLLEQVGGRQQ